MALGDAAFLDGRAPMAKVAVWFGHEGRGLSEAALAGCRGGRVHVDMVGSGDSLGVSAAVPLVMHEVLRKRAAAGTRATIGPAEVDALYARLSASAGAGAARSPRKLIREFTHGAGKWKGVDAPAVGTAGGASGAAQ
jgi:tRNA C32,U32 (ribose-2'-O)-methylase TrmJ